MERNSHVRGSNFYPHEAKIMLSCFAHKLLFVIGDTPFATLTSTIKRKLLDARNKIEQSV
jgi:hypothetical protein